MFWHNLKYEVLRGLRVKDVLFWLILFPIVLATFFKIAFGSIYEKTTLFSTIPMAVVETTEQPVLHTVLDNLESEKEPLFAVTYTDEQTALSLLKEQKVDGILYAGETLSLSFSENGVEQTIIKSFAEQYQIQKTVIQQTMQTAPEKMEAVIAALNDTVVGNQKISMTSGNPDATTNYFYNLLAMVAIFGSLTGMHIAINGQGNLSALGARKCCSPTGEPVGEFGWQLYFADRLHEHCGYLFGICIKGAVCRKYWIDLSFCNSQRIVRRFSWFFNWFIRNAATGGKSRNCNDIFNVELFLQWLNGIWHSSLSGRTCSAVSFYQSSILDL